MNTQFNFNVKKNKHTHNYNKYCVKYSKTAYNVHTCIYCQDSPGLAEGARRHVIGRCIALRSLRVHQPPLWVSVRVLKRQNGDWAACHQWCFIFMSGLEVVKGIVILVKDDTKKVIIRWYWFNRASKRKKKVLVFMILE